MRTFPSVAFLLVPAAVAAQPADPPNPDTPPAETEPALPPAPAPAPTPIPAPVPVAAVAETAIAPPGPAAGFALGASLELSPTSIGNNAPLLPIASSHVLLGYHAGRITFGATVDFERFSVTNSAGGMSSDQSLTSLLVGPVIRVAVARNSSSTTELLAVGDIAYRMFDLSSSPQAGASTDAGHTVTAHVGISVQHWLAPHFAVAATAAVRIDDYAPPDSSMASSNYSAALGYSLDMLGVF